MKRLTWGIGDVARKLRNRLPQSKRQIKSFAKAAGLDPTAVGRLERGGASEPLTVDKAAKALGVSVAELHALVPITVSVEMRAVLDEYWRLDPVGQAAFVTVMQNAIAKARAEAETVQ